MTNLPATVDAARALAARLFAAQAAAQADALAPLGDIESSYFRAAFAAEWERLRREADARRVRVTCEGTDGALLSIPVDDAVLRGFLSPARAAELAARGPFEQLFSGPEPVAHALAGLPGAVSAAERARRLAAEDALVEEAEGAALDAPDAEPVAEGGAA
jgi:hypothetical protein